MIDNILIIEDEKAIQSVLYELLTEAGYRVTLANDGLEGLSQFEKQYFSLILLDIMMPKIDGLEVLRSFRQTGKTTPVLFLTAKDAVPDRVKGLDSGANDYLVKPFSFDELMARLRAIIRNSFGMTDNTVTVADLTMDCAAHTVTRAGQEISLSAKEYALLEYLLQNKGIVLSREKIEDHIWDFDYEGGTNVVDVYIRYLRKKLDDDYDNKLIHTVRGRGYVIREEI
mgnify:CR=1 FL=1